MGISIKGLDKVDVLLALWRNSRMQGMSFLGYKGELTRKAAREEIEMRMHTGMDGKPSCYFDYLNGKVLKIDIGGDEIDPRLYDRDNGDGAAARAISLLARDVGTQHIFNQLISAITEDSDVSDNE